MARAYSQDLRERVIRTALGGISVRQAAARYGAGETMPVVKNSATYLSDGEGVLGVGRTVDDAGAQRAVTGPYCLSCGRRNEEDARFCDGCGTSLA